jgi:hypothetical protein
MNGPNSAIGKALRPFTRTTLPFAYVAFADGETTREDVDLCVWWDRKYPAAMKALMKVRDFKEFSNREALADYYICGYVRGLQEAVFQLSQKVDAESFQRLVEVHQAELERALKKKSTKRAGKKIAKKKAR